MQFTSLGYLLGIELAHSASQSALNLAMLGGARSLPVILLSPIAGYVADRYPRKRTLMLTNVSQAICALALAIVAPYHETWALVAALVLAGVVAATQSFDNPARQSWLPLMLPRQLLTNAIGLTSLAGNTPLMLGPALSGILIATSGVYASFLFQAASQWLCVLAILFMRPAPVSATSREPMLSQITSGIRFIASHAVLSWVIVLLIVMCTLLRPYTWLLATYAGHVLHVDAKAYGGMLTIGGIGTIAGALTTTIYRPERRAYLWFGSAIITAFGLLGLAFVRDFNLVMILLTILGFGTMSFQTSSQVLLQMLSPADMRGRSMSLYAMITIGITPAGTLVLGTIGSIFGLPVAYAIGATVAIALSIWVWFAHPAVRKV